MAKLPSTNDDQKRRLEEAQRHLAAAARAIDGASLNIRNALSGMSGSTTPRQPRKGDATDD